MKKNSGQSDGGYRRGAAEQTLTLEASGGGQHCWGETATHNLIAFGGIYLEPRTDARLTTLSHGGKPEFCSLACVPENMRFCATWGPGLLTLGKSVHLSGTRLPHLQKGKGENRLALMVSKTSVLKSLLSRMFLEMGLHV